MTVDAAHASFALAARLNLSPELLEPKRRQHSNWSKHKRKATRKTPFKAQIEAKRLQTNPTPQQHHQRFIHAARLAPTLELDRITSPSGQRLVFTWSPHTFRRLPQPLTI